MPDLANRHGSLRCALLPINKVRHVALPINDVPHVAFLVVIFRPEIRVLDAKRLRVEGVIRDARFAL